MRVPRSPVGSRDGGFTLIEVMVALGLLLIVTAAVMPQVIVGLRATATARDISQAKGVAQGKLEQMRSMPFYVGREAGPYIDVLDTYYTNTVAPTVAANCGTGTLTALPPTSWGGYVPASGARCPWEPAGPLYRKVINPVSSPGLGAFAMVISTQFLTGANPPTAVPPLPGYDSQTAGSDAPATSQVGVTVAVLYRTQSGVRYASTYSQIQRGGAMDPLIQSSAKATTVHVASSARNWGDWSPSSTDPADDAGYPPVTLLDDLGVVNLTGELYTGSRVVANATSAAAATSLPSSVSGAQTNLTAAPDQPATSTAMGEVQLPNGCEWVCFGGTSTDQVTAAASNGLPNAGTSVAPVRSMIGSGASRDGFWFDNGKWHNALRLAAGQPMVSLDTSGTNTMSGVAGCQVGASGTSTNNSLLTGTGFLTSTSTKDPDPEVSACATAQSNTIRLFPTTFAPDGVVRVTLLSSSAYCRVRRVSGNSAAADWLATVRYWNGSGYSTAGVARPSNAADPLDSVSLGAVVDPSSGLTLGDYISSWSSLIGSEATTSTAATKATVTIPGVVTILTTPTRQFASGWTGPNHVDPTSQISLSVGAASCNASDTRP